jgi:signal transduction histidine kinase/uncharacterized membrane protein
METVPLLVIKEAHMVTTPSAAPLPTKGTSFALYGVIIAIIAAIYVVLARIGFALTTVDVSVSLLWPPTGFAIGVLLVFGRKWWPGILLGAFAANYLNDPKLMAFNVLAGIGNSLEAYCAVLLLERVKFDTKLERVRDVLAYIGLAGALATMISATIGVMGLLISGVPLARPQDTWMTWWLGDFIGALVVGPPVIAWGKNWRSNIPKEGLREAALWAVIYAAFTYIVFTQPANTTDSHLPFAYLLFPLLVWAGLRSKLRWTSLASLLGVATIFVGTRIAYQRSTEETVWLDSALMVYFFGFISTLVTLSLFAINSERENTQKAREKLLKDLEVANKDLEKATAQALESTRLKSEFLATMSHELRTPLNAVIGYAEIMGAGMSGPMNQEQEDYNNRILVNAENLLLLINDILDLSKIESGRIELAHKPLDVRSLMTGITYQVNALITSKQLEFKVDIHPDLPVSLMGDSDRLKQIIMNLISNAVKFTDDGGKITVEVAPLPAGNRWEIAVIDTGIGIPLHAQQTIFEEFRQVDGSHQRKHKGTGLGLSIVRKLCVLMGGGIRVKSQPGEGSTFYVTLPLIVANPELQKVR